MSYLLKKFDIPLMRFDLLKEFDGLTANILWINEEQRSQLPIDLRPENENLIKWIKGRTIPANRAYVENFLARLGLNENDVKGIIDLCKGLSLNDSYWIVDDHFTGSFARHNLFENRFSKTLAWIAFTGTGSVDRSTFLSSPEFTTNGMLAKCWRRVNGKIILFKSGTTGAANTGNEPYSEYYASQIAEKMGLDAVKYNLSRWRGRLCSTCELFTNKDISFVAAGRMVREGGIRAILNYYRELGEEFYQSLIDMLVFDAMICNTDRHFGNFGFLVDNLENKIIGAAPIFDHGFSLFNFAMEDDLKNIKAYARTRYPATYPDFILLAKELMTRRQSEKLRRLQDFRFRKHPRYNLESKRLQILEQFVRDRALEIIGE